MNVIFPICISYSAYVMFCTKTCKKCVFKITSISFDYNLDTAFKRLHLSVRCSFIVLTMTTLIATHFELEALYAFEKVEDVLKKFEIIAVL